MARRYKVNVLDLLDVFAAPLMLGLALGRVGCMLNGCCFGRACNLPWALPVPGPGGVAVLRHPSPLYEGIAALGLCLLFSYLLDRRKVRGEVFALLLGAYSLARFGVEFFREGQDHGRIEPGPVRKPRPHDGIWCVACLPQAQGDSRRLGRGSFSRATPGQEEQAMSTQGSESVPATPRGSGEAAGVPLAVGPQPWIPPWPHPRRFLDAVNVLLLCSVGFLIRQWRIGLPPTKYFDEIYYVKVGWGVPGPHGGHQHGASGPG